MNEKKKILVFIDWFLPGYKAGGPIRSLANMVELLSKNFDFFIISSDRDLGDSNPYTNIKLNEWIDSNNYKIVYLSPEKQNLSQYKKLISESSFDLIYINSLFSIRFSLIPILAIKYKLVDFYGKIILAPRGMLGQGAIKIKKIKKMLFIYFVRLLRLYKNIIWHATNEEEKNDIIKIFGKKETIRVSPNIPNLIPCLKKKEKINEVRFYFLSRISQKKNLLFAILLFSNLKTEKNIIFDIYGPIEDKTYWKKCEQEIKKNRNNVKINYKNQINYISAQEIIPDYHFFILPTFHENYGHVIYEALSHGVPVIISNQTPWKNLKDKSIGWDICLSDRNSFMETIYLCIEMNQAEYDIISENAYNYAQKYARDRDIHSKAIQLFES
jgi:glycosyltransferase involved in cell wall biosynthesis